MGSSQVDFSRVPDRSKNPDATTRTGPTISVDTAYVAFRTQPHGDQGFHNNPDGGYFETAARADQFSPQRPGVPGSWVILEQYKGRDQALAGHGRWAAQLREQGLPTKDTFGRALEPDGTPVSS